MEAEKRFTHVDDRGNPSMVDVGSKKVTKRRAVARSRVELNPEIVAKMTHNEILTRKGPVFQTAITAGIMAAKRTGELIPLCHPLPIENCQVSIELDGLEAVVTCEVSITGKTGVEMEALTGASVAALTVYDMCKAFSHELVIKETQLVEKTGGKHDYRKE